MHHVTQNVLMVGVDVDYIEMRAGKALDALDGRARTTRFKAGAPCGGARPLLVPRQERSLGQPNLSDKRHLPCCLGWPDERQAEPDAVSLSTQFDA